MTSDLVERPNRRSKYNSALLGRVRCAICGQKMSASPKEGRMRFTCRGPRPPATSGDHPTSIYISEGVLLDALRPVLTHLLDPDNDVTVGNLVVMVSTSPSIDQARQDAQAALRIATKQADRVLARIIAGDFTGKSVPRAKTIFARRREAEAALAAMPPRLLTDPAARATLAGFDIKSWPAGEQDLAELFGRLSLEVSFDRRNTSVATKVEILGVTLTA